MVMLAGVTTFAGVMACRSAPQTSYPVSSPPGISSSVKSVCSADSFDVSITAAATGIDGEVQYRFSVSGSDYHLIATSPEGNVEVTSVGGVVYEREGNGNWRQSEGLGRTAEDVWLLSPILKGSGLCPDWNRMGDFREIILRGTSVRHYAATTEGEILPGTEATLKSEYWVDSDSGLLVQIKQTNSFLDADDLPPEGTHEYLWIISSVGEPNTIASPVLPASPTP